MSEPRLPARLLAGRDRLSVVEKDAILATVLPAGPARRRWWLIALPAVAAVALALIVVVPSGTPVHDDFAARGGATAALRLVCPDGCRADRKLLFDVSGTSGYGYFAAFAKRGDGEVIWYFPSLTEPSPALTRGHVHDGVFERSAVLGVEHPAGTYRVYGVFSTRPLSRDEIRASFDPQHRTAGAGTAVVERELVVQ